MGHYSNRKQNTTSLLNLIRAVVGSGHTVEVGEVNGVLDHAALAGTLSRSASRPAAVSAAGACLRQHGLLRHADGIAHLLAAAAVQCLLGETSILLAMCKKEV